jgi:hypothetical protein
VHLNQLKCVSCMLCLSHQALEVFCETFFISLNMKQGILKNLIWSSCKVIVLICWNGYKVYSWIWTLLRSCITVPPD